MNAGVRFLVGFETEFILLKSTNPIEAVNYYGWSNSPALPSGSVEAKVLQEIAEALEKSGIELQMYHAEAAPGQVRFSSTLLDRTSPLTSVLIVRSRHWTSAAFGGSRCAHSHSRDHHEYCNQVRLARNTCPARLHG